MTVLRVQVDPLSLLPLHMIPAWTGDHAAYTEIYLLPLSNAEGSLAFDQSHGDLGTHYYSAPRHIGVARIRNIRICPKIKIGRLIWRQILVSV